MGPEAAADVLAVVREAFGARPVLDPPADALGEDIDSVKRLLARRGGLLADLDDRPVGCVVLDPGPDGLVLRRFGVTPAAQGRGVASALVEAAVEAATGRSAVRVVAREELPGTVAFWEAHDFVVTGGTSPYVELARWLGTTFDAPDAETMRELGVRVGPAWSPATWWCSPASWEPARRPSRRDSARDWTCAAASPRRRS